MIYYFTLLFLCIIALPSQKTNIKLRQSFALLTLIVIGGLRYNVGTDWESYHIIFQEVKSGVGFAEFREEVGYLFLNYIVTIIGGTFPLFLLLLFTFSLIVKAMAVNKFGGNLNVALIVYFSAIFLIYDLNGLRQGLAIGFVMLAGWYATQRRVIIYLLLLAFAFSLHMVALVAAPLYFISNRLFYLKNNLYRILSVIVACVISYVLADAIKSSSIPGYLELFNLYDRYLVYTEVFDKEFQLLSLGSVQRILLMFIVSFAIDKVSISDKLKSFLFNCHALGLIIYFLLSFNMEFMARTSYYYKCFDVITLALIYEKINSSIYRLCFIILISVYAGAQAYQILNIPDGQLVPYKSLLENFL